MCRGCTESLQGVKRGKRGCRESNTSLRKRDVEHGAGEKWWAGWDEERKREPGQRDADSNISKETPYGGSAPVPAEVSVGGGWHLRSLNPAPNRPSQEL